jgi:hypothetical protein
MWYKIIARHTRINAPAGRVLTFWLNTPNRKKALSHCARLGIVEIELCEPDEQFEARLK